MTLTAAETYLIHNALVEHQYPSIDIDLDGTKFCASFVAFPLPYTTDEIIKFLFPLIQARGVDGKIYSGEEFLKSLPAPMFFVLFDAYSNFHKETLTKFLGLVERYVESGNSVNLWALFKTVGIDRTLTLHNNSLDILQRTWVLHNVAKDEKDKYTLIHSVFNALKPWLNAEMYAKVQEAENSTRENWLYDDPATDARLKGQAAAMLKKSRDKEEVSPDDLDIIEIEGNSNGRS